MSMLVHTAVRTLKSRNNITIHDVSSRLVVKRNSNNFFTSTSSSVAQRRLMSTGAAEKTATPPPPPPPASGGSSSGGGGSGGLIAVVLVAGLAGAYFKDDILKQLGMGTGPSKKLEVPSAVKELKRAASLSGAQTIPTVPPPTAAAAATPAAAPAKLSASKSVEEVKKEIDTAARQLQAAKDIAAGKTPEVDYDAVRKAVSDILEDESYDDGSYGPVFVRLAWHSSGTYDKNNGRGGSDGATQRFPGEADWGANAGLQFARARLEPIKAQFPGITYADLWILASHVAIEEMGGPLLPFRAGRKDALTSSNLPDGLLPDADGRDRKSNLADHLRDIFGRMGFNDQEIVALSGGHVLGRCHTDRSGYWGPWTRSPTTFSNEYYRLLLEEKWTIKKTHEGKPWTGPEQYEDPTGELMMLPTDIALIKDPKMKPWVEKYAKDEKLFFDDFTKAWTKLTENGVKRFHGRRRYWLFGPRE